MQATTRGGKTSAGQGKAGVTKPTNKPKSGASQAPAVTRPCSTGVTKASPQRCGTTLPVNTTTEAGTAVSNSEQQSSDCSSAEFVWPTPWASAASAPRNEAPDQGQSFRRLPAASHCWPARSALTAGTTARESPPVKLVWLARRERHQGRARQVEGHFWDRGHDSNHDR